jgi:hypothetical protein
MHASLSNDPEIGDKNAKHGQWKFKFKQMYAIMQRVTPRIWQISSQNS